MMLDYFYGQSGELFAYFRIPKALFQDSRFRQLSTDARTLYGILLDRMSLSAKNSWVDEHGRVYMDSQIFLGGSEPGTLKDLSEMLGKETIDAYNTSDTRGNSPSYSTNYSKLGHELLFLFRVTLRK